MLKFENQRPPCFYWLQRPPIPLPSLRKPVPQIDANELVPGDIVKVQSGPVRGPSGFRNDDVIRTAGGSHGSHGMIIPPKTMFIASWNRHFWFPNFLSFVSELVLVDMVAENVGYDYSNKT